MVKVGNGDSIAGLGFPIAEGLNECLKGLIGQDDEVFAGLIVQIVQACNFRVDAAVHYPGGKSLRGKTPAGLRIVAAAGGQVNFRFKGADHLKPEIVFIVCKGEDVQSGETDTTGNRRARDSDGFVRVEARIEPDVIDNFIFNIPDFAVGG